MVAEPKTENAIQGITSILSQPDFDAVDFLNNTLPSLSVTTNFHIEHAKSKGVTLQEAASRTQNLHANLNTQIIRDSSELSRLTDEIVRSGSRLAYEVEVLRGDANALHESLTETLLEEISKFTIAEDSSAHEDGETAQKDPSSKGASQSPEFIRQLRMLGQVKTRLEEVVKVFGEAMEWPLAPSESSLASSLISVSAPESGSESHTREERGKEFSRKTKAEITKLLNNTGTGPDVEAALQKVEALRVLATVWKGTTEERPRNKFVESLSKTVTDRRDTEGRHQPSPRVNPIPRPSSTPGSRLSRDHQGGETGGGLFRNLQRLRDEIYLE